MNLLDAFIQNYENDGALPTPPMPTAQAVPSQMPPSLMQAPTQPSVALPPLPQGDTSMVGPMALLNFAARVAQQRRAGQSRLGQALEAGAGAAQYAMNEKRQIQDQATRDEINRRKMAQEEANLRTTQLQQKKMEGDLEHADKTRPLDIERLELAIANAKDERTARALEIKAKSVAAKYAEDFAKVDLQVKRSQSDENRAQAELYRANAQSNAERAAALMVAAEAKAAGVGAPGTVRTKFKPLDGFPGDRPGFLEETTGRTFYGPMDPAAALSWAEKQARAMARVDPKVDMEAAMRQLYGQAVRGNLPADPSDPAQPASPAQTPTPKAPAGAPTIGGGPKAPEKAIRNEVYQDGGQYWLVVEPGKPMKAISREDFEKLKRKSDITAPTRGFKAE